MRARRNGSVLLAMLGATLALVFATPASAGTWSFSGKVGIGAYSGPCIFYWNMARCSGWNYWFIMGCNDYSGGTILCGFENTERIRGFYVNAGQGTSPTPSDVGMGGYILAHATWWSGPTATIDASAAA